jgi:hypothetical protein
VTNFLVYIAVINIACWAIRIACYFWKSRNWKPTPFLLPVRPPW